MTKKISAILLSMLMMVVFVPMMSSAIDFPTAQHYPSGIDFTSAPYDTTDVGNNGCWYWTSSIKQLILDGNIWTPNASGDGDVYGIKVPAGTTIIVRGNSQIWAPDSTGASDGNSYAIWAMGDLTIKRDTNHITNDQALDLIAGEAKGLTYTSSGIHCEDSTANLVVDPCLALGNTGKMKLNIYSTESTVDEAKIYGIDNFANASFSDAEVKVCKSDNIITATGYAGGIMLNESFISKDSKFDITTNNATGGNYGIYAGRNDAGVVSCDSTLFNIKTGWLSGNAQENMAIKFAGDEINEWGMNFNNCSISAEAGDVYNTSVSAAETCAIYSYDQNVLFNNTKLYAKSGDITDGENSESVGIHADYDGGVAIWGSNPSGDADVIIAGTGTAAGDNSVGIKAEGAILLKDVTANATVGSADAATDKGCVGLYSEKGILIQDSKVSADAGQSNEISSAIMTYASSDAESGLFIDGSKIYAKSNKADDSKAIAAMSYPYSSYFGSWFGSDYRFTIDNSDITAIAGEGTGTGDYDRSAGLYAEGMSIKATNSKIVAKADKSQTGSIGIDSEYYDDSIVSTSDFETGGDIKLVNTDVDTSAKPGYYKSYGIFATGQIISDVTGNKAMSDITANAECDSTYASAICGEDSVDIQNANLVLDVTGDAMEMTGIEGCGNADNAKCIHLRNCNIDLTVAGEAETASGIYTMGMDEEYNIGPATYDPDLVPCVANVELINCKTGINMLNGTASCGKSGIEAQNGKVMVDNSTTSSYTNIDVKTEASTPSTETFSAVGILASSDAQINGLGKVTINASNTIGGVYGIVSANNITTSTANLKISCDSYEYAPSYGLFANGDVNVLDHSKLDISDGKYDNLEDYDDLWYYGGGIVASSDANIENSTVRFETGEIAIQGVEKVNLTNSKINHYNEEVWMSILAGSKLDFDNRISSDAELNVTGGRLDIPGMVSMGTMSINNDAVIHCYDELRSFKPMTVGDATNHAYLKHAVVWDASDKAIPLYETSGDPLPVVEYEDGTYAAIVNDYEGEDGFWLAFHPFNMHLVNFVVSEHGVIADEYIWVEKGHKIGTYPTVSAEAGYKFVGWYTNEDLTNAWNDSVVNSNVTLYAKIVQNSDPTPPYNPGGGGSVDPTEPEKPTPSKDIDIKVDPIPAGSDITSETVGENIEIKDGDKTLVEGKDYVVYVDKSTKSTVGYKEVSVIGIGSYDGTKTTTYIKVLPKTATIKTITAGTGKLTYKWKKVAGVDNYVVRIATNKNFTKNKVVKYTKGTTTAKTFKNLKSGKKYYVQVRALTKNIENPTTHKLEKFYGKWSKVKSITVK